MPDRLMEQDARPARPQHHFHFTGRSFHRAQLYDRLASRLAREVLGSFLFQEESQLDAPAASTKAPLHPAVFFRQAKDAETGQWLEIAGDSAVGGNDQHVAHLVGIADAHLRDARVVGARRLVAPHYQIQLGRNVQVGGSHDDGIQVVRR